MRDAKVMVADITYNKMCQMMVLPSSEQLKKVLGLSSVTIRFVMSL